MSITRARALRRTMTQAEHRLWRALRARRLAHVKFRRQVPLGPYTADFLSKRHRLVIEVDGGQHGGPRDALRDERLAERGYRTLRLWNDDVMAHLEGVLDTIAAALLEQEALLGLTQRPLPHPPVARATDPSPSPLGRGAVRANASLHQRLDTPLPNLAGEDVRGRDDQDKEAMP
mgnify:FL=1|jgi:2-isopropylmalate synthase